jgi:predicted phosphodiesterase
MAVAPHADKVIGVAVPGNHGENRQGNKSFTSVNDNDDVAIFEQVAEILSANKSAIGHVGWRLSTDEIALSLNLSGVNVAFTHGHVARAKGNAAETLWGWWQAQAMGRAYPGVADSEMLIAGHYHHLNVKEQEGRAVFITPSLTQVSEYWSDMTGTRTRAGTLSMVIQPDGWGELTLL